MNNQVSSIIIKSFSKTRLLIILLVVILLLLLVTGIVLLVLFSLKPCIFTKCHSKASQCIKRAAFKAQCICNTETVGNGRTVCDECGIKYESVSPRIIGGEDAVNHSWPFAAFIRQQYKTIIEIDGMSFLISTAWMCGGTLINHKTILTAGHCLKYEGDTFDYRSIEYPIVWNKYYPNIESSIEVTVGSYNRRKRTEQRIVKVHRVTRHPNYNDQNLQNDIAILKLEDYLQPSPSIQFACLSNTIPDANTTGTVIGWGATSPNARKGSTILQQVNLTIYPDSFCSNVSPRIVKNWDLQLCCGDLSGERDACHGDSGGGLFIQRNFSQVNRYTVEGIVSYGERCASRMKPAIYTRVSHYFDWIREQSDF